jgi:hypothetical protein
VHLLNPEKKQPCIVCSFSAKRPSNTAYSFAAPKLLLPAPRLVVKRVYSAMCAGMGPVVHKSMGPVVHKSMAHHTKQVSGQLAHSVFQQQSNKGIKADLQLGGHVHVHSAHDTSAGVAADAAHAAMSAHCSTPVTCSAMPVAGLADCST